MRFCALLSVLGALVPTRLCAQAPPPSAGHELVYHDSLGMVVLVGSGLGAGADTLLSGQQMKLWGWDGVRWTLLDSTGPTMRNLAGVAYDRDRNVIVLYGGTFYRGSSGSDTYDETWEWRRSGWRRMGTAAAPGPRDHTQMVYDPMRRRSILFGGQGPPSTFPSETWAWDGTHWERVDTAGPPARVHHALTYDADANQVVVFGGYQPDVAPPTMIWVRDSTWRAGAQHGPRTHMRTAYDERANQLYVFGGMGAASAFMALKEGAWRRIDAPGPSPRYLPGLTYDRRRGVLVLFGGGDETGLLSDTWEFDGNSWRQRL
jgi:hypothetical protein